MKQILACILPILFVSLTLHSYGQNSYDLNEIHSTAKALYVKPETLDRLMIQLRVLEKELPAEQEELFMETYRIISSQYVANNHYSQAYQVYLKYITFKEGYTARKFMLAVDTTKSSIQERRLNDGTEVMNLQNQVQQLEIDNDLLISKRLNFKKYFSFIIIALSTIFALILVKSAMKLFSISTQLKENRQMLKSIHRASTLGMFAKGVVHQLRQKTGELEDLAQTISSGLQSAAPQEKNAISFPAEIRTQCKEIIKVLNSSGIEA